jgi:hypothetical protein
MGERTLLLPRLGLPPGNLALTAIHLEHWGSHVVVEGIYRFPPDEKPFRVLLHDCRTVEWLVQKPTTALLALHEAQLLSHDLGQEQYGRPARFATPLAEVIIHYARLKLERLW